MAFDIRQKRKDLNLTLEEIAQYVGVGKSTVKKWESGYIRNMRRDKIIKLANILKVSPIEILQGEDFQADPPLTYTVGLNAILTQKINDLLGEAFGTSINDSCALVISGENLTLINSNSYTFNKIVELIG